MGFRPRPAEPASERWRPGEAPRGPGPDRALLPTGGGPDRRPSSRPGGADPPTPSALHARARARATASDREGGPHPGPRRGAWVSPPRPGQDRPACPVTPAVISSSRTRARRALFLPSLLLSIWQQCIIHAFSFPGVHRFVSLSHLSPSKMSGLIPVSSVHILCGPLPSPFLSSC